MPIKPSLVSGEGPEENAASALQYELKLSAEMKDLNNFSATKESSIGRFKQYDTTGSETGQSVDIFTVAGLDNNRYGELHHSNEAVWNPGKLAIRHAGWYDKKLASCVKLAEKNGRKSLRLCGDVIDDSDPEFKLDTVHREVKDPITNQKIKFKKFNICVPWLTTFGASYDNGLDMFIPDISKPNITIEKNCFIEIKANFGGYKAEAFRTSLWLLPATKNNNVGTTVLFDDSEPLRPDGTQNFVKNSYHASVNPMDGVEIDVFEFEKSNKPGQENWILMKTLGDLGDQNLWTHNTLMSGPGVNGADAIVPNIDSGWHTIGLLWLEDRLVWFVDGKAYVKDEVNRPNNVRMQIILSREINAGNQGGADGDPRDTGLFGNSGARKENRDKIPDDHVDIEYIRVWQARPGPIPTPQPTPELPPKDPNYQVPPNTGNHPEISVGGLVTRRYGQDNGELFWERRIGPNRYKVYQNGIALTETMAVSLTTNGLTPSNTYHYEVMWLDEINNVEVSLGVIMMPLPTGLT